MPTTDIEKARQLFGDAGLAFPTIPQQFEARLKEQREWLFATREIKMSPYNVFHYVREAYETHAEDYVVLCHSGHGVNSYAVQYYLVLGALRMFLHLGWGGVYCDAKKDAALIHDCFSVADQIVPAAQSVGRFRPGERLLVVACDFYESFWMPPEDSRRLEDVGRDAATRHNKPLKVLEEVLHWVRDRPLMR
jgi:hypothetical protein